MRTTTILTVVAARKTTCIERTVGGPTKARALINASKILRVPIGDLKIKKIEIIKEKGIDK